MKKLTSFFLVCLFVGHAFSQQRPENPDQFFFRPSTHSESLKSSESNLQAKSFYQSKADWQTIIDTTWGSGLPLNDKLTIFDTYTGALTANYDDFDALGIDPIEWDSIKSSYRSRINSSTSKGAFVALMGRLVYDLRDLHAYELDTTLLFTPLKPGVPILVIGAFVINHFGAVLTVSPDNSLIVLRTIDNHPLGLQPGDIVIGYEGVPWKDLVDELLGSGIPILYFQRSAKSASRYNELTSAGMNWHLFDTIDIVKYTSGDTVHLPVYPLADLPAIPLGTPPAFEKLWFGKKKNLMCNNEQLPVPGVPFLNPDEFDKQSVTYGIVEGTNIGYIYLCAEIYEGLLGLNYNTDEQFYEAVKSLSGTEGLIIDIRFNYGGWGLLPHKAFNLLNNIPQPTFEHAVRCNQTDFSLCPGNNQEDFSIPGNPMFWYDRPLAILTGPNCVSAGDIAAYRFKYLPMARFFGKSTCAALGGTVKVSTSYTGWFFYYSVENPFKINDPDFFLNHQEFPVDDSVWFDAESAANGEDAVAQKAVEWIQNLSYAHNVKVNSGYAVPGTDTITLTAQVINPSDHDLSVKACINSSDSIITDTIFLYDDGNHNNGDPGDGIWGALWPVPETKTIFTTDITTEDLTAGSSQSVTSAVKFTTIGPVGVDTIACIRGDIFQDCGQNLYFKVTLRNNDTAATAANIQAKLTCLDTTLVKQWSQGSITFQDISPGGISTGSSLGNIIIPGDCPADKSIPLRIDIFSDLYPFWSDTFSITVRAPIITAEDQTIYDGAQTNIDIRGTLNMLQTIYYTYTSFPENEEAITGNTSDTIGVWEKINIKDNLNNTTDQIQKVEYTITPYIKKLDNSIGCPGKPITVNIWVEPFGESIKDIDKPLARIYPNPAKDIINIEIGNTCEQETEIELLTVSGQVIYRKEYKNSNSPFIKQIDLSGYSKGVYFLKIRQEGAVYNGKVIVM